MKKPKDLYFGADSYQIRKLLEVLENNHLDDKILDLGTIQSLFNEYSSYGNIVLKNYQESFDRKLKYFESITNGAAKTKLEGEVLKKTYTTTMFDLFLDRLRGDNLSYMSSFENFKKSTYWTESEKEELISKRTFNGKMYYTGNELADFLKNFFTKSELVNNKTTKELKIHKKRFGIGAKITRIISYITELYHKDPKISGNMVLQPDHKKDVYLSLSPYANLLAGFIGDSCLSPKGQNFDTSIATIGIMQSAVIHNEDFSTRALLLVDKDNKNFYLGKTYPRENFYMQIFTYNYFKSLGYKHSSNFYSPNYYSFDSIFKDEEYEGEKLDLSYNFEDKTATGVYSNETFCPFFYLDCMYNEDKTLDPGQEDSENSGRWSDYGERYLLESEESIYWSDQLDSYIGEEEIKYWANKNSDLIEKHLEGILEIIKQEDPEYDFPERRYSLYTTEYLYADMILTGERISSFLYNIEITEKTKVFEDLVSFIDEKIIDFN